MIFVGKEGLICSTLGDTEQSLENRVHCSEQYTMVSPQYTQQPPMYSE